MRYYSAIISSQNALKHPRTEALNWRSQTCHYLCFFPVCPSSLYVGVTAGVGLICQVA